jgi:hypothetical protein
MENAHFFVFAIRLFHAQTDLQCTSASPDFIIEQDQVIV